jgi:hypothetical protein
MMKMALPFIFASQRIIDLLGLHGGGSSVVWLRKAGFAPSRVLPTFKGPAARAISSNGRACCGVLAPGSPLEAMDRLA